MGCFCSTSLFYNIILPWFYLGCLGHGIGLATVMTRALRNVLVIFDSDLFLVPTPLLLVSVLVLIVVVMEGGNCVGLSPELSPGLGDDTHGLDSVLVLNCFGLGLDYPGLVVGPYICLELGIDNPDLGSVLVLIPWSCFLTWSWNKSWYPNPW